jgi:hypothetical protein
MMLRDMSIKLHLPKEIRERRTDTMGYKERRKSAGGRLERNKVHLDSAWILHPRGRLLSPPPNHSPFRAKSYAIHIYPLSHYTQRNSEPIPGLPIIFNLEVNSIPGTESLDKIGTCLMCCLG